MSQVALAAALGIDQPAMSRLEQGRRMVRLGEAAELARALNVGLDDLAPVIDRDDRASISLTAACAVATKSANAVGQAVREWIYAQSRVSRALSQWPHAVDPMSNTAAHLANVELEDLIRSAIADMSDVPPEVAPRLQKWITESSGQDVPET